MQRNIFSIHTFRMGSHQSEHKINEIIQFAGSWSDLPEEYFKNFYEEVEERRRTSSSRKFSD